MVSISDGCKNLKGAGRRIVVLQPGRLKPARLASELVPRSSQEASHRRELPPTAKLPMSERFKRAYHLKTRKLSLFAIESVGIGESPPRSPRQIISRLNHSQITRCATANAARTGAPGTQVCSLPSYEIPTAGAANATG